MIPVPVDHNYRMDIKELETIIRELAAEQTPVLGVVGVVGSTEEGQSMKSIKSLNYVAS